MDRLCVSLGPERQENGLLKLGRWTQILLRNPDLPPRFLNLKVSFLTPNCCCWPGVGVLVGGRVGHVGKVEVPWPSSLGVALTPSLLGCPQHLIAGK